MTKTILTVITFAIAGLIIGYLLFGKIGDTYISLSTLLKPASNEIIALGQKVAGVTKIKNNIAICGGIGAIIGIAIRIIKK